MQVKADMWICFTYIWRCHTNQNWWLHLQPCSSPNNMFLTLFRIVIMQILKIYTYFTSSCSDLDAPTNLATTEVTEDTIAVSWDGVQAHIGGYMLSYDSADGSSSVIPVGRDSTSYRLIGLKPGVLHNIYIWAFKEDKVSKKSSTQAETGKLPQREKDRLRGYVISFIKTKELHKEGRDKPLTSSFEASIYVCSHILSVSRYCVPPTFYRGKFSSQRAHLKIAPLSPHSTFDLLSAGSLHNFLVFFFFLFWK